MFRSNSASASATSRGPCARRRRGSRLRSRCLRAIAIEWVGQFRDLTAALERLSYIVPLSIGVILLLLLANFRSLARHGDRRERVADGADRRHFRARRHRHAVQRIGGDRFCRSVRHRRDGRHHHSIVFQSPRRSGKRERVRRSLALAMYGCARS